jgi:hypothetical protein
MLYAVIMQVCYKYFTCFPGFRGTVTVLDLEDTVTSLSLAINSIPLNVSDYSIQCNETGSDFLTYTYASSATPTISLSQKRAIAGDSVTLELVGLSDVENDNILVFGNTDTPCLSSTPSILSTSRTQPSRDITTAVRTYSDYTTECVLPNLPAGKYRPVLHVSGRGWGHSYLEDSMLTIYPQITSTPSITHGSLRGGTTITLSTRGLSSNDVLRTGVKIGNTPCKVEHIDSEGMLTCFTEAAVDDGYSSLIRASAPLSYWSLQTDYRRSNGSYLNSDGIRYFRGAGIWGTQANASVHGIVSLRQRGISGNSFTDQSIRFDEAAFLRIPGLEELFGFGLEFWLQTLHPSPLYRLLVNATSSCNTGTCGFVVMLNPCERIEFWVASEEPSNEGAESEDGSAGSAGSGGSTERASGEGLTPASASGEGLGGIAEEDTSCSLITEASQCPQMRPCNGYLRVTEQRRLQLPVGLWHIISSDQIDVADWNHVHVSWHPAALNDCTALNSCNGAQGVAVNGVHQSISSIYHGANNGIELGGSSSVPQATTNTWGGLAPFTGYLDEVALYNHPLHPQEISDRVRHVTRGTQPIWLAVEGFDGVGAGSPPNVVYPLPNSPLNPVVIDWEVTSQLDRVYDDSTTLQFQWTG